MTTADDICAELGFTVSDARSAAARVERRKARLDDWHPVSMTTELPDGSTVYLHQLVLDTTSDVEFMVAECGSEQIKLVEVQRPILEADTDTDVDDDDSDTIETPTPGKRRVSFGPAVWLTLGQFVTYADAQYTTTGTPVFAY